MKQDRQAVSITSGQQKSWYCTVAICAAIAMLGCSEGATGPGGNQPENDFAKHIPLYSGSIGLVVDTRDIFKKGYKPATAAISFTGQTAFDTVLTIDSLTDVAILTIQNDSLSDAQKTAFANGIATTIIVQDASHTELGRLADVVPVDNSNSPVSITTSLPLLAAPPVLGGSGTAYLLQREGVGDLVTRFFGATIGGNFTGYDEESYQAPLNPAWQQFTFTQRADSTYLVGHLAAPDSIWCAYQALEAGGLVRVLRLDSLPSASHCQGGAAHVVLEQDPDGWMRLKLKETGEYVALGEGGLTLSHLGAPGVPNSHDEANRFRLIADDIDWTISDRGTSFLQPVLPPAKLDFAYLATLTNCSPATLTETVGRSVTEGTTTTFSTSESSQLFAGVTGTIGTKFSASATIPDPPLPIPVNVSAEVSTQLEVTTSVTLTKSNTSETSTTSTQEVSRERSLQLPPFTAVIVADYTKHIDNVIQPFTQKIRVRGAYKSTGTPLSGAEIITQLRFNFVQGVVTRVAADYVEFTIRGAVTTDHFLLAETTVQDNPTACQ